MSKYADWDKLPQKEAEVNNKDFFEGGLSDNCKVVLYHLTQLVKLEQGVQPCTKTSDLLPLIEHQYRRETGADIYAVTLGKCLRELERRGFIAYRKIKEVYGIVLGDKHPCYQEFVELYAQEDQEQANLRMEFESLFVQNKKGNYYYTIDYDKYVTIFKKDRGWAWVYDGAFSDGVFATAISSFSNLKGAGILNMIHRDSKNKDPKKTKDDVLDFEFDEMREKFDNPPKKYDLDDGGRDYGDIFRG